MVEWSSAIEVVLDNVLQSMLALTSAMDALAYGIRASAPTVTARALSWVRRLAECLPDGMGRADVLRQIDDLEVVATRPLLFSAPETAPRAIAALLETFLAELGAVVTRAGVALLQSTAESADTEAIIAGVPARRIANESLSRRP